MLKPRTNKTPQDDHHVDGNETNSVFRLPPPYLRTPTKEINWPGDGTRHLQTQVQQLKTWQKPQANPNATTLPAASGVPSRTLPQVVERVHVTRRAGSTSHDLIVQFHPQSNDPYFHHVNVYLRSGKDNNPTLVASGATSPIRFTAPKTQLPSVLIVTSVGPMGETKIESSPSKSISLG